MRFQTKRHRYLRKTSDCSFRVFIISEVLLRIASPLAPPSGAGFRCLAVRFCVTCVAPFPGPRACRATRTGRLAVRPAHGSAPARRRTSFGRIEHHCDIDSRTRYFPSVISCLIDRHYSNFSAFSSIQTLAFQQVHFWDQSADQSEKIDTVGNQSAAGFSTETGNGRSGSHIFIGKI